MSLSAVELAQRASNRYAVLIIGGDAVFLGDRVLGQKLYLGPDRPLSRPEFRQYVVSINKDLDCMSTVDFFSKYGIRG